MSEFLFLPTEKTIEARRAIYKEMLIYKAAGILLKLEDNDIEPDVQIETLRFAGKKSERETVCKDDAWIITQELVDRQEAQRINIPKKTATQKKDKIIPILVSTRGWVLANNPKLILPFSSISPIGEQPKPQYIIGIHDANFVKDENIGKDGYVDTGIMAGLDRLDQIVTEYSQRA